MPPHLAGYLLGACIALSAAAQPLPITLRHVHGLAYSADGTKLMIPSHDGLAVFERGRWSREPGPPHDYMGFSAGGGSLYASGHPAPGSGIANPFGLIRSRDGGRTWESLGLQGESDFHLLAASGRARAIYVWSEEPNSRMRRPGLHYTLDDGRAWRRAQAAGLEGEPRALAVHPENPALVAVATPRGVFESVDSGSTFNRVAGGQGTAVFYDLDGRHLWYGLFDSEARLARSRLRAGPVVWMQLPRMENDAVAYVAQNPASRSGYAIATFRRNVYVSVDAGRNWSQVAERGAAR